MVHWEYMTIKLNEFVGPEGEEKRAKDYWVSPDGLLPMLDRFGAQGWEGFAFMGTDVIMKRPIEGVSRAVIDADRIAAVS